MLHCDADSKTQKDFIDIPETVVENQHFAKTVSVDSKRTCNSVRSVKGMQLQLMFIRIQ